MMKARLIALLFISVICLPSLSLAADKYVRAGASGNGSGWSSAYGSLGNVSFSGMSSGDTLWIAAGTYSGGLGTVSTNGIKVRRATSNQHGASDGWLSSYDGQVTVNLKSGRFLAITADNVTVDGASHAPWKFRVVGMPAANGQVYIQSGSDNTTIRNIEFDGNSDTGGEDGFRVDGGARSTGVWATVRNCTLKFWGLGIRSCSATPS
jgi:polygalacturonase